MNGNFALKMKVSINRNMEISGLQQMYSFLI